ncbi:HECT-domain (ubiquitin-transferase) domain-containing protein, partial [Cardiosporidium cionae]
MEMSFIPFSVKQWLFHLCLSLTESTRSDGRLRVSVNRPKALRSFEKGQDADGLKSVFGQLYKRIHFVDAARLRGHSRPWYILYEGEGGIDAGGLFRDALTHIGQELQSNRLQLFLPCPNARGYGDNQDQWIPNPSAVSALSLSMFTFVGKLMGVAIRSQQCLSLDLPAIVWKQLTNEPVGESDLEAIDALCIQILQKIRVLEFEGVTNETFQELFPLNWSTTSSDGRIVELKPNGTSIPVEWNERFEYVSSTVKYRLEEFNLQREQKRNCEKWNYKECVAALRRGLGIIVPIEPLTFFSAAQLEQMVCGSAEVDIHVLKAHTRYNGYNERDNVVIWLWEILEEFASRERQLFLRFVWGRSRLPLITVAWEQQMEVVKMHVRPRSLGRNLGGGSHTRPSSGSSPSSAFPLPHLPMMGRSESNENDGFSSSEETALRHPDFHTINHIFGSISK